MPRYIIFVCSSTVLTYSLHRLIGIRYSQPYLYQLRFAIVNEKKHHIMVYTVVSAAICLYLFWNFELELKAHLAIAGIISVLYSIPLLSRGRRVRDISFVKIFLIAGVWAYVTTAIPLLAVNYALPTVLYYSAITFLFIMSITIPFDIRDIAIDHQQRVPTLASTLGVRHSRALSLLLLAVATLLVVADPFSKSGYKVFPIMEIGFVITGLLIWRVRSDSSDYWYTGVLDGSMMLFLIIYLLHQFISQSLAL